MNTGAPAALQRPLSVLMQRYGDSFDLRHGGGIERALHGLSQALAAQGVQVHWYTGAQCPDADAVALRAREVAADAVYPLVDSPLFWRAAQSAPAELRARVVRIWHDVAPLTRGSGILPACGLHAGPGQEGQACAAAHAQPGHYAAEVFFRDEPWTHCFPRRRYIPWAVDHLPQINYRDRAGPVLLLAGKSLLAYTIEAVEACRSAGVAVRIVFSGWTTLGRQAKAHFANRENQGGCEIFEDYHLEQDHARIFGGASAALVLSQYHETFNFLAAECAHFGLPVIAFSCSGATRDFSSLLVPGMREVRQAITSQAFRELSVPARPRWGWHDVAAAHGELVRSLRQTSDAPARRTAPA
jgi:UDP-N-acetyl-D-glucosamine:ribostamycin N-acetyl-D-glucosaminyltransferase